MSKNVMQDLARHIESKIPNKKYGFILLVTEYGDNGRMHYVSNCQREDVVEVMKEFIEKTETDWGTHKL